MVKSKKTQDKYLKQVYFNPKETGSLGGIKNLKTSLKLKKNHIKQKQLLIGCKLRMHIHFINLFDENLKDDQQLLVD